jgi:hypothetical protein
MNIFFIGASGFVSTHFIETLKQHETLQTITFAVLFIIMGIIMIRLSGKIQGKLLTNIDVIIRKALNLYRNFILRKIAKMLYYSGEYRFFSNEQEISWWLEQNKNIVVSSMDNKQFVAVQWYAGYWAERVNTWLRTGHVINCFDQNWGVKTAQQITFQIESIMQHTKLEENIIAVRWIYSNHFHHCFKDNFRNLKVGKNYIDNGFLSTSLLLSYCGAYDNATRDLRKNILLLLKVPSNTIGFYNNVADRSEFGFIIERGQQISIEKIYRFLLKPFIVVCRIVPRSK